MAWALNIPSITILEILQLIETLMKQKINKSVESSSIVNPLSWIKKIFQSRWLMKILL